MAPEHRRLNRYETMTLPEIAALPVGHRDPDRTATAWRNGWFHTGDLMRRDAEGNYYIVDRLFEHAQLVLGSGKKAQKVEISRDHRG